MSAKDGKGAGPTSPEMMALASRTSSRMLPSGDFIKRGRNPSLVPPERFQRVGKTPGSRKLVLGKWVEVKADDDDADTFVKKA